MPSFRVSDALHKLVSLEHKGKRFYSHNGTQMFGVKVQDIRGNQIFVGPRLDLGVHVACDKLHVGSYCVILLQ